MASAQKRSAEARRSETGRVPEAIRRTPFRIRARPLQTESKKERSRFRIINPEGTRRGTLKDQTKIRFGTERR